MMKQEKLDQMLAALGQEIEEEQLSKGAEKHDFSEKYQHKKQELLSLAEQQNKKKTVFCNRIIKRILQTAAVLIIVSGISFTAYATAKNNRAIQVEIKEQNIIKKLSIEVKRKKESEEIVAVPEYLPDGYEEWDVGRYSLGGVWAAEGISIAESNGMEEEELPYEAYEIWKIGNTKNLLVDRGEGNGYRWNMLLFDEKKGHIVQIFAAHFIPKEEVLKIGKHIKIYEKEDFPKMKKEEIEKKTVQIGDKIEYPEYAKGCSLQVTDIIFSNLKDESSQKEMEVTIKLENTTDKLWEELPVCPLFWSPAMEEIDMEDDNCKIRELPVEIEGGIPDNPDNKIYYVKLKPHSEKEVHLTYIVPKKGLKEGYLEFFGEFCMKVKK